MDMAHWVDVVGAWLVNSGAGQCIVGVVAFLLGAVGVASIDEWYKRSRQIREEASVAALEELFALPDLRDCRRR